LFESARIEAQTLFDSARVEAETVLNEARTVRRACGLMPNELLVKFRPVRTSSLPQHSYRQRTRVRGKKIDALVELEKLRTEAQATLAAAKEKAAERMQKAETELSDARARASEIVDAANKRAQEIAGDAYQAMQNAKELESTARAMKNVIEGTAIAISSRHSGSSMSWAKSLVSPTRESV
jgi:F0F1-type ATP synthase membrane subunit b/b'